ncbi:hypothetical protein B0J14DRAFT_108497 [Halenospora varia]|nr:hypothetical protein B0J14DRAFT_108497 [Halenospora varia]
MPPVIIFIPLLSLLIKPFQRTGTRAVFIVLCSLANAARVVIVSRHCRCLSGSSKSWVKLAEASTMLKVSSGSIISIA